MREKQTQQMSLFDGSQPFKIDKPIRLIELFGGIGSQAKALERLGVDFEHYRMNDIDEMAVKSYNAIHGTDFVPTDIRELTAQDLGIVEKDKYCYIMTYSFPCQDLSMSGKRQGMDKGSNTRSSLLWEVERLLYELNEIDGLPQVLLMENVDQIINQNNMGNFQLWLDSLESLGYKNYYKILNAKNHGIPQNRARCFMVSLLGDYYYVFPTPKPLTLKLKDMLQPEEEVDEKYFVSKTVKGGVKKLGSYYSWDNDDGQPNIQSNRAMDVNEPSLCLTTRNDNQKVLWCDEMIEKGEVKEGDIVKHNYMKKANNEDGIVPTLDTRPDCLGITITSKNKRLKETAKKIKDEGGQQVMAIDCKNKKVKEEMQTITTRVNESNCDFIYTTLRIRKLTPLECIRLMGFDDEDYYKMKAVGMKDTEIYKQCGNSIVVNVLVDIFKEML